MSTSSIRQLTYNSSGISSSMWILDSCASHHMSPNSSFLLLCLFLLLFLLMTADGTLMPLTVVGFVVTLSLSLSLSHDYHIPNSH